MSRSTLKYLAILLSVLIVGVYFLDLDGLPRSLRAQAMQERTALDAASKQLHSAQDQVLANLKSEADLFRAIPNSQQWPEQLSKSLGDLQLASHKMDEIAALAKRNRRQDRQQLQTLLSQEHDLRSKAVSDATGVEKEASHWIDLKHHLPEEAKEMEQDYGVVHSFDLAPVTAKVQKAEADWPEKAKNLEKRLNELQTLVSGAESAWANSGDARRLAAANDLTNLDLVGLVAADTTLKNSATELPAQVKKLDKHASQLYLAWDKILVDMTVRDGKYEQDLRTVETQFANAAASSGDVTSNEKWVDVPQADYDSHKNDLGMAIEHKAAGMYESEADHVAQPAGFAYVAPPTQGSNRYGYWENRDGHNFWVFYAQYSLMRDLLFNHQYQPVDVGDWEGYRTYQSRGQTYYGGSTTTTGTAQSAPRYGTQGSTTQTRYANSSYAKGGGFKNSQYATKSGSYNNSQYATPGGNGAPKQFGSGSRTGSSTSSSRPRSGSSTTTRRAPSPPRRFGKR